MSTKKKPLNIQLSDDTRKALDALGAHHQLSGNQVLAAAAGELAKVQPGNLWHALGRIADGEDVPALNTPAARRIERGSPQRALQVAG